MNLNDSGAVLMGEEFLSLVSHEIKNPLTSITGYANFVEEAVRSNNIVSALECLDVVRSEARRILRLAEDLLDVSCVRAGKFRLTTGEMNVAGIVSAVAQRYARSWSREIEVCCPANFPAIAGDQARMGQVIENLLSNALKYSPDGSKIAVRLEADDVVVRVCISNSGTKIEAEKLAMLFKRFSRLRTNNGNGPKGTGLGLYISKQIVEAHGGTIAVASTDGEGTTFTIALPREAPAEDDEASN